MAPGPWHCLQPRNLLQTCLSFDPTALGPFGTLGDPPRRHALLYHAARNSFVQNLTAEGQCSIVLLRGAHRSLTALSDTTNVCFTFTTTSLQAALRCQHHPGPAGLGNLRSVLLGRQSPGRGCPLLAQISHEGPLALPFLGCPHVHHGATRPHRQLRLCLCVLLVQPCIVDDC
jgi:hypothetical protein